MSLLEAAKKFITDAVILTGLTAWSYLLVFLFQTAYLSHFGIPSDFVSIDLIDIVKALFLVVVFVAVCFFYFFGILPKLLKIVRSSKLQFVVSWVLIFIIFGGTPYLAGDANIAKWGFVLALIALAYFLVILLVCERGESLNLKLIAFMRISREQNNVYGDKIPIYIFLFIWISLMAFCLGTGYAKRHERFLTFEYQDLEYVVIKGSAYSLLAMPINRDSNEVKMSVGIFDPKNLSNNHILFEIEKIPGLKVSAE